MIFPCIYALYKKKFHSASHAIKANILNLKKTNNFWTYAILINQYYVMGSLHK
jgi:hypothetical protein